MSEIELIESGETVAKTVEVAKTTDAVETAEVAETAKVVKAARTAKSARAAKAVEIVEAAETAEAVDTIDTVESAPVSFVDLGLSAPILRALADVGYETPSSIQAGCIPILLAGKDLLGMAQTGTGKTAAFALPILNNLDVGNAAPQALVLTPTRELAIQVAEAFARYARHLPGFHVLPIYGGQSYGIQLKQLARGAHVIVGTPGRIMDHLERESLSLAGLKTLVLDEGDEMLRMGFIDDVEWILEHTPAERQTALFSATMPDAIRRVAQNYLLAPEEVSIRTATQTVAAIRQCYWQVSGLHKLDALTRILEVESEFDAAIIFVRTKLLTEELADKLEARGHSVAALNGDMNQQARERVIEQLKSGSLDILVATDVAARGIDVPRVSHVINYDIPYDAEAYVHRIGRTGRAGRAGTAILFVAPREMRMLRTIERVTRQPIEHLALPTQQAVTDRRVSLFKARVAQALTAEDLDFFENLVSELGAEQEVAPERIAAALAFLAQKERPLRLEEKSHAKKEYADRPPRPPRPDRFERFDRPPRRDRPDRLDRDAAQTEVSEDDRGNAVVMARYRVEVGRAHGVSPKDIVGAIANEGNLPSRLIGRIDLYEEYSTVDLPNDLSRETMQILRSAWVRRRQLNLAPDNGAPAAPRRSAAASPPRPRKPYGGERPGAARHDDFHGNEKPWRERAGGRFSRTGKR
ncbi:MAG: DEAD/DEAH box helicase [Zoogloeaceae bacterium]|jgi:ATP-dependent RNA helicase DeaD|nr:DEAD/DEAH box helicase [Zoogloeaceae bacterium]